VSRLAAIGTTPSRLIRPTVGFTVTTPFCLAGEAASEKIKR
jgi:hypothetical protein